MLCLWCPAYFSDVDGYDTWESRVNERLSDAIGAGELVPINIQSDGAFGVRVAIAPPDLTEREQAYAVVKSDPYLLVVRGGELCLSGIEGVGDTTRAPLRVTIADGRYTVAQPSWHGMRNPEAAAQMEVRPTLHFRTSFSRFPPRHTLSITASSKSHSIRPSDLSCRVLLVPMRGCALRLVEDHATTVASQPRSTAKPRTR